MPRISFPYHGFPLDPTPPFPNGQTVWRPWAVAVLTAPNGQQLQCLCWPDSGADHCVFPLSFAIALGLDPLQMKSHMTGGVGNSGNVTVYETIKISLNHSIEFSAYVGFTAGLEAQGIGLLGQSGFFSSYVVTFDYANRQFHIEAP